MKVCIGVSGGKWSYLTLCCASCYVVLNQNPDGSVFTHPHVRKKYGFLGIRIKSTEPISCPHIGQRVSPIIDLEVLEKP